MIIVKKKIKKKIEERIAKARKEKHKKRLIK